MSTLVEIGVIYMINYNRASTCFHILYISNQKLDDGKCLETKLILSLWFHNLTLKSTMHDHDHIALHEVREWGREWGRECTCKKVICASPNN